MNRPTTIFIAELFLEVDYGMARTRNRDVTNDIAEALHLNYAVRGMLPRSK